MKNTIPLFVFLMIALNICSAELPTEYLVPTRKVYLNKDNPEEQETTKDLPNKVLKKSQKKSDCLQEEKYILDAFEHVNIRSFDKIKKIVASATGKRKKKLDSVLQHIEQKVFGSFLVPPNYNRNTILHWRAEQGSRISMLSELSKTDLYRKYVVASVSDLNLERLALLASCKPEFYQWEFDTSYLNDLMNFQVTCLKGFSKQAIKYAILYKDSFLVLYLTKLGGLKENSPLQHYKILCTLGSMGAMIQAKDYKYLQRLAHTSSCCYH